MFDRACLANDIEHKLTKPYHPWTNGQAERMNRTLKDATTKVFHYPDLESLKAHVLAFVTSWPSSRPTTSPSTSSGSDGEPPSRPLRGLGKGPSTLQD